MPHVQFTPQLRRFIETPTLQSQAETLAQLLEDAFAHNPALRSYVLDDQGDVRPHVAVFVDGQRCMDLRQTLRPDSKVYVLQALSGG